MLTALPARSVQAPVPLLTTFRSPATTVPGAALSAAFHEARVPPPPRSSAAPTAMAAVPLISALFFMVRPFKICGGFVLLPRTMPWLAQDSMPQTVKIHSRKIPGNIGENKGTARCPDGSLDGVILERLSRLVHRVVGVSLRAFAVERGLVGLVEGQAVPPAACEVGVGDRRPAHHDGVRVAVGHERGCFLAGGDQ